MGNFDYGIKDVYTDENGNLRLWLPPTGSIATITITMSDGSKHYFCFVIRPDGTLEYHDYLIVNGDFVFYGLEFSGGNGWHSISNGTVFFDRSPLDVSGVSTNGELNVVVSGAEADAVTLLNLRLVAPKAKFKSAFAVSNAACTVTLSGDNMLVAQGQYAAGMEVTPDSTLTIRGNGSLVAIGGKNAAGIGSRGGFPSPGRIVIESGTIIAQGGGSAAGIGGGLSSTLDKTGNIVVTGGNITAQGGEHAAGIGAGYHANGAQQFAEGAVRISGGTVLAAKGVYTSPLGGDANVSDMISSGNLVAIGSTDRSFVVTGGSVHGANMDMRPNPVGADGETLNCLLVSNLVAGAEVSVSVDGIPATYDFSGIVADSTGSVCLWLPEADVAAVSVNGEWFAAGLPTNSVASAGSGEAVPCGVKTVESLKIERVVIGEHEVSLTVSAVPDGWIGRFLDYIVIVAAENIADLSSGDPSRTTRLEAGSAGVQATVNGDGTATVTIPRSSTAANVFYKIDVRLR